MKSIRLRFLLLTGMILTIPFRSYTQEAPLEQTITISFENETLKTAVKRIEKETGISFAYSNHRDMAKKVTATFTNQKLSVVLTSLLASTSLSFKEIAGKVILYEVSRKEKKPDKATIHGYVTDSESGERLINANIFNPDTYIGTISNNFGFYSYSSQTGKIPLVFNYMGYQSQSFTLDLKSDTSLNVALRPRIDELGEVTVIGSQTSQVENTQMSMINLPVQKLEKIPVILGEADVLKVIQLLPGVQTGMEGTSGIYVRGGGPDQNLFLLDGVPVYNPSHLLGIFSAFNPEALKSVKLYKGGFPARFGGRLSSVVDVSMKDGNMKELHGNISVGIISSKLSIEGPIIKDKTSFILSARRTYLDLVAQPLLWYYNDENGTDNDVSAFFHDINLKLNYIINDKNRIFISGYHGKDYGKVGFTESLSSSEHGDNADFEMTTDIGLGWGNVIGSIRWNHLFSNRLFSNTTLTYSKYNFLTESKFITSGLFEDKQIEDFFRYSSGIEDINAKIDFDYYPVQGHNMKFGVGYTNHYFTPGVTRLKFENELAGFIDNAIDTTYGNREIYANEISSFVEDNFSIRKNLKINAGLHLSVFFVDGETYINPQPRLSLRFKANDNCSLKASYSRMAQYVHLLTTYNISMPSDLWLPVTKDFDPPVSDQFALGSAFNLPQNISLTVEAYYKKMKNLIEYKEGASFMGTATNWESKVEKGMGWSYGTEFMLEKKTGKTTGWIAYTFSWSNRKFENLNFGETFPAKYDNRHDISIALTHKFSDRCDIGGTWVYRTGNAFSLAVMEYPQAAIPAANNDNSYSTPLLEYDGRNNYRMSAYHRLDLGINFHKKKKHGTRTWSFSVYNCYNHQNPFIVIYGTKTIKGDDLTTPDINESQASVILKQYSLFPIIPSISYSFKF
ncbi:MAG: TonB-dependent receptor [Prolixibacteraceae bacterium]|nr:TonB-dependent receptor [Prolixibacteraceae bacterium]